MVMRATKTAITTVAAAITGSKWNGTATAPAPKLAAPTQTAQTWPLSCAAGSSSCVNKNDHEQQMANTAPSHVFDAALRNRCIPSAACGRL